MNYQYYYYYHTAECRAEEAAEDIRETFNQCFEIAHIMIYRLSRTKKQQYSSVINIIYFQITIINLQKT